MYTDEERAKWRRMFKQWKETGESPWSAGIRKEGIPYNNSDYDYARAAELGYKPDETGHMPSRDVETGRYLKSSTHPTIMKSIATDIFEAGYNPYYNSKDGKLYSDTWMKLPKFEGGKGSNYFRPNGNQIKIDENTGELVDLVNGERGTLQLPEVTVSIRDPKNYRSAYNPSLAIEGFNALTLGGSNNLSLTQWARRFYDAPKLFSGDMSFSDYTNRWLNGNEGIVSKQFAKNHPYYSAAINMAGDVGSLQLLKNIPAALRFVDRGFVPQKNILSQTDNTMTRYIGTGDSGYKDALMSDVIRGNINPPRFSAAELAKLRRRFKNILSEDDFRDLASNNIRSEEQFDRINNILSNASSSRKVGRFDFGKNYSLGDSWEEYLQDNARNQNLVQQQAYMQSFSRSKEINDWIKNWRVSTDKSIAKGHPLPTFALSDEVLTNSRQFPGDYAVQIKNADKYARTAEAFGHFKEHPTTYRPMSPFEEDVTMFRRQDGLLTGHKYMVKVPKSQMAKDKNLYTSNPTHVADPIIRNGFGVDYNKLMNMQFNGVRDLQKLQVLPFFQNIQTMKSE